MIAERTVLDTRNIPTERTIEANVDKIMAEEERLAADAFNLGRTKATRKLNSNLTNERATVSMAGALAQSSNSSEGWLTFFSASARGSLPALSTVKPKRISPFYWKKATKEVDIIIADEDDGEEIGASEDRTTTLEVAAGVGNETVDTPHGPYRIPKPHKQFVSAVSSAKAAATQALQHVKDKSFQTAPLGSPHDPGGSRLHERFGSKHIVHPADIEFYEDHKSIEAMAKRFQMDVLQYEEEIESNNCERGFEWFISHCLTEAEIQLRDKVMSERADSAEIMVEM